MPMPPVALITGASRGIGAACAQRLAADGYHVILTARDQGRLTQVADSIRLAGGSAETQVMDISDNNAITRAFASLDRLDLLVANAGIGRFAPFTELDPADLDTVYTVNVRGTALCAREAVRRMLPVGSGRIIVIGSIVSTRGYPGQAAYTASKHAVLGLTKSLAAELHGSGLRAAAILPGGVDTDMVDDARPDLDRSQLIAPEDVADAVAWIAGLSERCCVDVMHLRRPGATPFGG